jgi:hypothetical protein
MSRYLPADAVHLGLIKDCDDPLQARIAPADSVGDSTRVRRRSAFGGAIPTGRHAGRPRKCIGETHRKRAQRRARSSR